MPEEQYASKRQRQKARRAERLAREAAAARAAKGRQRAVYGGIVVLVIALVGGLIYSQIAARQARDQLALDVEERLDELGCTPAERMPDLGGGHITAADLAVQAPELIYTGDQPEPPSSGPHFQSVVPTGVYDVAIDPRLTTHNLEHGYVIAHYAADAPEEEVEALKAWAQEGIDGDFPKLVVAPYYTDLANGANFSLTAWFYRQTCDAFDADVAQVFLDEHYETSEAPEATVPTHNVGAQGVIDPAGEPLFLPPLDVEFGADSALDAAEEAGPGRPEVDADGEPVEGEATEGGDEPAEDDGEDEAVEPVEAVTE